MQLGQGPAESHTGKARAHFNEGKQKMGVPERQGVGGQTQRQKQEDGNIRHVQGQENCMSLP